jgi:hypothetical protein
MRWTRKSEDYFGNLEPPGKSKLYHIWSGVPHYAQRVQVAPQCDPIKTTRHVTKSLRKCRVELKFELKI